MRGPAISEYAASHTLSDVTPGDWTPGDRYIGVRVKLGRGQEVIGQISKCQGQMTKVKGQYQGQCQSQMSRSRSKGNVNGEVDVKVKWRDPYLGQRV